MVPVLSYLPCLTAQKQQGGGDQSNEVGSTRDGREKEHIELKIQITIKCTIVTMYCAVLLRNTVSTSQKTHTEQKATFLVGNW